MEYPQKLTPNSYEKFEIDGKIIKIPKANIEFNAWNGKSIEHNFGKKPIVDLNGSPMFAELAITHIFNENGWNSRWIETYGKPKLNPIHLTEWIDAPFKNQKHNPVDNKTIQHLLNEIAKKNENNFGGCWDVVAWKNDDIIFAESKRSKKDSVQMTQNKWLKSALETGLKEENFIIIEWKI
jgi:uncharacterized protein YggL (DUF469 family)